MKKMIAITTTTFGEYDQDPVDLLVKNGFEIVKNESGRALSKDEIPAVCGGCVGIVAGTETYDHDTLKKLDHLKVISRVGVGLDNVDVKAAKTLGIKVVNTPFGPVNAVAELTVGLMLNMLRNIARMDRDIRAGTWKKGMGNLLCGKKVGIIGYGRIGQRVAELLISFGCDIAYNDLRAEDKKAQAKAMSLAELLSWADIVTIHISGKERLLGKKELGLMKKGSWLVNVSRGGTVDESVLYDALRTGRLAGAAIDVFNEEPYKGALRELDNVILTPHVGSYAVESRIGMERDAVKNLIKELKEVV